MKNLVAFQLVVVMLRVLASSTALKTQPVLKHLLQYITYEIFEPSSCGDVLISQWFVSVRRRHI